MKISGKGLDLIKSFEGCRLQAYKCPAGVWTIGWGHTGDVMPGQTITREQADRMLRVDLAAYEAKVMKYDTAYNWNQNEFDALTSFAYNVGSIDQLTAKGTRSRAVIADKLQEYNRGGGRVLAGLTRRRQAERELFLEPIQTAPEEPGWKRDQHGWWYLCPDGNYPANAWKLINHHWHLFNKDGYMCTSWHRWDGHQCDPDDGSGDWYYFDPTPGENEGACWHEKEGGKGILEVWYAK